MNRRQQADLEAHRASLRADPSIIYLADEDCTERVVPFESENGFYMACVRDVQEYDQKYLIYAQNPKEGERPSAPKPARFGTIANVDKHYKYFMSADGDWNPRSGIPFPDTRPSAFARSPNAPGLARDFRAGYNNLIKFTKDCIVASGGGAWPLPQPSGIIDLKKAEGHGFKFGARVFAKRGPDDEDDGLIGNWPVSQQAAPELEKIKLTHRVIPIPAFNVVGQVIPPQDYATELRGATVSLTFHLKHWVIRNKHIFTADIESIKVLVPAPPPTPKKDVEARRPTVDRAGGNAGGASRRRVVVTID